AKGGVSAFGEGLPRHIISAAVCRDSMKDQHSDTGFFRLNTTRIPTAEKQLRSVRGGDHMVRTGKLFPKYSCPLFRNPRVVRLGPYRKKGQNHCRYDKQQDEVKEVFEYLFHRIIVCYY